MNRIKLAVILVAIGIGVANAKDASLATHFSGSTFLDCPKCPTMVVVPAGSYRMGSPAGEVGRHESEAPVREVTIAPFAIGRYEVTVAEFGRFVDETGYSAASSCHGESGHDEDLGWRTPGFDQSAQHPVVCVSWYGAQAYVEWLSRVTRKEYRLPSEREWEYAARAGTTAARQWGGYSVVPAESNSGQCRHANGSDPTLHEYRHSKGATAYFLPFAVSCRDEYAHTAPVGSFAANRWGLHDMLGNVWEWTESCLCIPPGGSGFCRYACGERALRGGSWSSPPGNLRFAHRTWGNTSDRAHYAGFRVARSLAP